MKLRLIIFIIILTLMVGIICVNVSFMSKVIFSVHTYIKPIDIVFLIFIVSLFVYLTVQLFKTKISNLVNKPTISNLIKNMFLLLITLLWSIYRNK